MVLRERWQLGSERFGERFLTVNSCVVVVKHVQCLTSILIFQNTDDM